MIKDSKCIKFINYIFINLFIIYIFINCLYFIFNKVNGCFEEINGNKYSTLVPTNESKEKNKKYEQLIKPVI